MGQIITSLINFFLEVGRSKDLYNTPKNQSRVTTSIRKFFTLMCFIGFLVSFNRAYLHTGEANELKEQIVKLESLRHDNEALRTRNEILSRTLGYYIGNNLVEQINSDISANVLNEKRPPPISPDTDKAAVRPLPPASK